MLGNKPLTVSHHVCRGYACWEQERRLSSRRALLMNISFELIWKCIQSFGFDSLWWRLFRETSWWDLTQSWTSLSQNHKILSPSLSLSPSLGSIRSGLALDLFNRLWMEPHLNIFVRILTNIFSCQCVTTIFIIIIALLHLWMVYEVINAVLFCSICRLRDTDIICATYHTSDLVNTSQ